MKMLSLESNSLKYRECFPELAIIIEDFIESESFYYFKNK